jgi:anti-sigma factor RsiW
MGCAERLTTQAYLDGELDAAASLRAERHLAGCEECSALSDSIVAIRNAVRREAIYYRAPPQFRSAAHRGLESGMPSQAGLGERLRNWLEEKAQFLAGAGAGLAAAALAASLALFAIGGPAEQDFASDMVSAHIRSLIGTHLIDVASSDHHTVKPWFGSHADVSPPVQDFAKQGFRLIGGRVDYVDGKRAAVTVYRHGGHVVNVFAWKDAGDIRPGTRTRNGYQMISWHEGGLFFCAVSDTERRELVRLSGLIEKSARTQE